MLPSVLTASTRQISTDNNIPVWMEAITNEKTNRAFFFLLHTVRSISFCHKQRY
jgi:hypothetical protein